MGVSLVRSMGSRLPLCDFRLNRPGGGKTSATPVHPRMVHAPEWSATCLRLGVRRCEPARACLGSMARLRNGPRPDWKGGSSLSGARVPQADAQLHLVGE